MSFNLDERIEDICLAPTDSEGVQALIKQLIRDVIEEVKPERDWQSFWKQPDPPIYTEDDAVVGYEEGYQSAIDEMEAKAKELGL